MAKAVPEASVALLKAPQGHVVIPVRRLAPLCPVLLLIDCHMDLPRRPPPSAKEERQLRWQESWGHRSSHFIQPRLPRALQSKRQAAKCRET